MTRRKRKKKSEDIARQPDDGPHMLSPDVMVRREGDLTPGRVTYANSLRAVILWENGIREEVDQYSPEITICRRT